MYFFGRVWGIFWLFFFIFTLSESTFLNKSEGNVFSIVDVRNNDDVTFVLKFQFLDYKGIYSVILSAVLISSSLSIQPLVVR